MFRPQGLFTSLRCPNADECKRDPCPFSHRPAGELPTPTSAVFKLKALTAKSFSPAVRASQPLSSTPAGPSKRPPEAAPTARDSTAAPPKKIQKIIPITSTGAPKLVANFATSKVPVPTRQKLLATMYEAYRELYSSILVLDPGLPGRHALAQELEVYDKSSKTTYRNAMITALASIKKRPRPDKLRHPSVGTATQLAERMAEESSVSNFKLLPSHLEPIILSRDDMIIWDYVVDVPPGPGGDRPSEVGNAVQCDRCGSQFIVRTHPKIDECSYHWSRPYSTKVNGTRETIYRCCSTPSGSPGCQTGPHVFYEKLVTQLHSRHPFSTSEDLCPDSEGQKGLDICAIDCEMVYTTAAMSVARISIVDGNGDEVFDSLVRMSQGVDVLDLNTRFSGITSLDDAVLDLDHIKQALGAFIGPRTIIIGHALENDLKTLRMVHHRAVDTTALYPHKAGPPYRRALRDLAREILGQTIQAGGGTTGHSSVEDARASLDLVRAWIMERSARS